MHQILCLNIWQKTSRNKQLKRYNSNGENLIGDIKKKKKTTVPSRQNYWLNSHNRVNSAFRIVALKALQCLTLIFLYGLIFHPPSLHVHFNHFWHLIPSLWKVILPLTVRKLQGEKTQPIPVASLPVIQSPLLIPTALCGHLYISIYHILVIFVLIRLLTNTASCLLRIYTSSL